MEKEKLLLEHILDGAEDPTNLSLALLQRITDNFSEGMKIGQGGFAAVYKGVFRQRIVAVKKIEKIDIEDKLYDREFKSLWKNNHENVVRFLGLCSNTCKKPIERPEGMVFAEVRERLFCFEYISGGSLDKHITDELRGLEWETRYKIILGICRGLCYLHEKNIVHMDLKPANILLDIDNCMVPKITDFGLSRPNTNSHTVAQPIGTRGYIAPEYWKDGRTTPTCDIYSLGAIIMELITGDLEITDKHNVLRRWRHRWNNPPTAIQYQQLTGCIDVAVRCREKKPGARPSIKEIVDLLGERKDGHTGQESTYLDDDMLGIEPLELDFHKDMSWTVKLTNKTKAYFAFKIERPSIQYTIGPDKGIVPPECDEYLVWITLQPQDRAPQVPQNADKFVVQSTILSNGLINITEDIFRTEDGKVVDEVDLMVVYERAKPQEDYKREGDTNMLAEEVPEAKKRKILESAEPRKIGESASGKGKNKLGGSENEEATFMNINSSTKGQYNLHPPQCFARHYPTIMKYLGKESDRAVDHVRGAMGSLLDNLGKLVTVDYSLDPIIKSDIESFSVKLSKIHLDLPKLQNFAGAKVFVDEVRELSYKIEDMVDSFLVRVEPDSSSSGFMETMHESVKLFENGKTIQHQIGDVIRDIKEKVEAMVHTKMEYNFNVYDVVANSTDKAAIYPRMAVYRNKEQLIGIEAPRDEIIGLLEEGGDVEKQGLRIVSIVGLGGSGKTTLAKAVYEEFKGYNPKAFVPVGQDPDPVTILKKIIRDCQGREYSAAELEHLDVWQLSDELHNFLKDKRYFVVIDDLWSCELWDTINFALPRDKCGSRVITTTRIQEVIDRESWRVENRVYRIKPLSDEDSRSLFNRRTSGLTPGKEDISKDILKRCGGMPLAINSIASHLARHPSESSWEHVRKSLGAIKGNDIENMKAILDLSYIHLPDHLKTCLLHVCMYPEDREIDKKDLLMQWIAEGFVGTERGQEAEDVAEEYFKSLIDMFMIEPGEKDHYDNELLSCRVHDIILELMRSKSSEMNFIQVIDGLKDVLGPRGEIRRVSVEYNDKDDGRILETIKGSLVHARSVLLYRRLLLPNFLKCKYVRVLHLEDKVDSGELLDLTSISSLFFLRYLKIACYSWSDCELKLPGQIGQLQQLETIDVRGYKLKNYPSDIVTLPWLSHLRYSGDNNGVMLPNGIERLKYLHTLEGVWVGLSSVETIKGLSELTNLRNLGIDSSFDSSQSAEVVSARMNALYSSILKLFTSLRILTLEGAFYTWAPIPELTLNQSKEQDPSIVSHIGDLDLGGSWYSFERFRKWIGQLHYLKSLCIKVREVADGIIIVGGLPSLAYFHLCVDEEFEKEESVVISGSGAFQALKHLVLVSTKTSVTFEEGAMPKLEKLHMPLRHNIIRRLAYIRVGIEHLPAPTLKQISLTVSNVMDDCKVKGSQHWNHQAWVRYLLSDHHQEKIREHIKKKATMLKRAFKLHHPSADIYIYFDGYNSSYSEVVDKENDEEDGDEKHDEDAYHDEDYYFIEEDDEEADEGASQVNGSQTSAQVLVKTRQLVQLIEEQKISAMMDIESDAPPLVDTLLHLAVGSEGRESGHAGAILESMQLSFTRPLAPSSPSSLDLTLALAPPLHGSLPPPPCSSPGRAEPRANFLVDQLNGGYCYYIKDDEAASQVNGSQSSAWVLVETRQFFQLIEEQKNSGTMSINTDAPPMVDTSVGSEGRQSERTQDLAVWESLHIPSTSLVGQSPSSLHLTPAPCSSSDGADINNDLLVQLGNN